MIVTVVGNYPKTPNAPQPQKLRQALAKYEKEEISQEELQKVEEEVAREVLTEQVEAGVDLLTDGMVRWEDGQTYIARALRGFSIDGLIRYFDTNVYFRQPVVEGAVRWTEPITVQDFQFAVENSPRPVKAVLTGPYTLARLSKNVFYTDDSQLVFDLAEALNHEARALAEAGAPLIQFDEPSILKHPQDFDLFRQAIEVTVDGVGTKTALYTYFRDIDGLYPQLLELPIDVIGLDFVSGSKNWELLDAGRFDKELAAGIVDARNTRLESVAEIVEAIRRLSRSVPLDRLYVNPNCGLEFLPREVAQAKLARLAEGAREALRG